MSLTNPHALLLASAPAELHLPILTRLTAEVRDDLLDDGAAPGLVAYALAHGTAEDRAVLAENPAVSPDDLAALAATPDEPQLAAGLFGNPSAPREAMLRVLPFVPDADVLPGGFARNDAMRLDMVRRASVAVESEDPKVLSAVLRMVDSEFLPLCPAVVLRGCLGLLWTVGREPAWRALRDVRDLVRGDLSAPVRDALADPFAPASLGRALAYESSLPVLLERLRRCRSVDEAVAQLHAPRDPVDWEFVLDVQRREPLPDFVRAALARQIGCPEVLPPLGSAGALASTAGPAHAVRDGGPDGLDRLADDSAAARVGRDYTAGRLNVRTLLREGDPVAVALSLLEARAYDDEPDIGLDRGVVLAVAELTRPALGGSADAWVVALNLLGDFAGTLPELVRTASAVAA
ncbi:hypothetical protein [Streptodolium elevatio]